MYGLVSTPFLLAIPFFLSIAHIVNALYEPKLRAHKTAIRSFTAGFSVAYVFLLLLLEIADFGERAGINTAVYILLGFTLFHVAHKIVFKEKDPKKRSFLIDEVHLATISAYSLLITFFLVELTKLNALQGVIISFVIIIHTILIEISQKDVGRRYHRSLKVVLPIISTLIGGLLAIWSLVPDSMTIALLALTAGAVVYMAIREEIPSDKEDKSLMFLIGVLVMYILLSVTPLY